MNICFLFTAAIDPQKGGAERVTRVLADALISKGHCVSFLSTTTNNSEACDKDLQSFFPEENIDSPKNELFLERFLKEEKINIMVFQAGDDKLTPFPRTIKKCGTRLITVVHTGPNFYKAHTLHKFILKYGDIAAKAFRPIIAIKTLLRERKQMKILKTNACTSDKVVLLSEKHIPDFSAYIHPEDQSKITAISNPTSFHPDTTSTLKKNEILYVGRMSLGEKRVDLLLKIWSLVQDDFSGWTLRLVGGGSDLEKLKNMAKRLRLSRISFEGFQKPEPYYRSAKIFCLTSSYEGFPMVFSEAAAFGCIPIAFDSFPVASEFIHDGKNGFLIPPFDVKCYAKKLAALMANYPTEIAENAKENIKRYAVEPIISKWIALFEDVMKDNEKK